MHYLPGPSSPRDLASTIRSCVSQFSYWVDSGSVMEDFDNYHSPDPGRRAAISQRRRVQLSKVSGAKPASEMTDPRQQLLHRIRDALGRGELSLDKREALDKTMRRPTIHSQPQWETPNLERFVDRLRAAEATVASIDRVHTLPETIAQYMQEHQLPPELAMADDAELTKLSWKSITTHTGANYAQYTVSLTPAFCGVAETGTLVLLSSVSSPTTLNFLFDHHIVLLHKLNVVRHIEDVWIKLRKEQKALPRTVNFITGPSRTADIEQTIQLGAHGPRHLHVILLDNGP